MEQRKKNENDKPMVKMKKKQPEPIPEEEVEEKIMFLCGEAKSKLFFNDLPNGRYRIRIFDILNCNLERVENQEMLVFNIKFVTKFMATKDFMPKSSYYKFYINRRIFQTAWELKYDLNELDNKTVYDCDLGFMKVVSKERIKILYRTYKRIGKKRKV